MTTSVVVLAAGLGSRFGGTKQLEPVGPAGEALLDYAIHDALCAGFGRIVVVGREDIQSQLSAHVVRHHGPTVPVSFTNQVVGDLPAGLGVPVGRTRPWGTGHAVLSATTRLDGPFAVCNADDWYGPEAFRLAATHLATTPATPKPRHAIIGYRLGDTLSRHGGVSRAVATTDAAGRLETLAEMQELVRGPEGIRGRTGTSQHIVSGSAIVSMNLWAFDLRVLDALRSQFRHFVAHHGSDPTAEFPLSTAINGQVRDGIADVSVMVSKETWMGITFAADLEPVRSTLADLVRAGAYPPDLRLAR